jgi:hypothetical protein
MGYTWNCSSISFVREIDIRLQVPGHLRYNLGNTATVQDFKMLLYMGQKNFLEENLFKSKVLLVKSL